MGLPSSVWDEFGVCIKGLVIVDDPDLKHVDVLWEPSMDVMKKASKGALGKACDRSFIDEVDGDEFVMDVIDLPPALPEPLLDPPPVAPLPPPPPLPPPDFPPPAAPPNMHVPILGREERVVSWPGVNRWILSEVRPTISGEKNTGDGDCGAYVTQIIGTYLV